MKIKISDIKRIIKEAIDDSQDDMNAAVEELMGQPEYKSLEMFAEYKIDNDEEAFDAVELQALARNMYLDDNPQMKASQLATAPSSYREKVKSELEGYGIRFTARAKIKQSRGFTSPLNGSNRFAGNHGGSGFDNAFNMAPSSKRTFSPNDPTSLGMGSKKKR